MRITSIVLAAIVTAMAGCSSSQEAELAPVQENIGTATQALGESSPYLDANTAGYPQIQTWTSQYGPETRGQIQTNPGVCGLVHVRGGFGGGDNFSSLDGARVYLKIVPDPVGGPAQGGRYQLVVQRDTAFTGLPAAKVRCFPRSMFQNTARISAFQIFTELAGAVPGGNEVKINAPQTPLALGVWGGAGGYIGGAATAASSSGNGFISKYWNYLAGPQNPSLPVGPIFQGEYNTSFHHGMAYAVNQWANYGACSTSPVPNRCRARAYGLVYTRTNAISDADVGWVGAGAYETMGKNGPGAYPVNTYTTIPNSAPAGSQFCFLSGIARKWDTSDNYAEVLENYSSDGTAVLRTAGPYTEASARCIPFAQTN